MAELQEACQLLISSPVRTTVDREFDGTTDEFAATPSSLALDPPWAIPKHLFNISEVHDAAIMAFESGRAAARNPESFDRVMRHGLNLQELAARMAASAPADQLLVLNSACEVYKLANDLQQGKAAIVPFNWAVALSDVARLTRGRDSDEAKEYLVAASRSYKAALSIDPCSAQALNNLGLVLQELATLSTTAEARESLFTLAIYKFRAAVRLQPSIVLTSRFCYNLGTALYARACSMADAVKVKAASDQAHHKHDERRVRLAYAHAACYIALSYGLQPGTQVYQNSFSAVERLLPLPYLRTGFLLVLDPRSQVNTYHETWVRAWFALDARTLQSVRPPAVEAARVSGLSGTVPNVAIDIKDVITAHVCLDPSLPKGWALWLDLKDRGQGMYLLADDREDAEGWVDALRILLCTIGREGGSEHLEQALHARRQRVTS